MTPLEQEVIAALGFELNTSLAIGDISKGRVTPFESSEDGAP